VAFLLLVEGKSNAMALDILNRLIENLQSAKKTPDKDVRYAAYKNRGWANFAVNDLDAAQTDLAEALTIDPVGASAHCLIGKVLEARAAIKPDAELAATAKMHFGKCVRYAPQDRSMQPTWLSEARRKMD
jgi:Tfp pilus assembly protein PilF